MSAPSVPLTYAGDGGPRELMTWHCIEDNDEGGLFIIGRNDGSNDYVNGWDIFLRNGRFYAEEVVTPPASEQCGTDRGTVVLLLMLVACGAFIGAAIYFAGGGV